MSAIHWLSVAIWLPIVGGVAVLATGGDARATIARPIALVFAVLTFAATIPLYLGFDTSTPEMQFVENTPWVNAFGIRYHLGIDGISLLLILLTSFSTVLVVISAWEVIQKRVAQYLAAFLFMEGLMIGVFCAVDAILFYVFWEAMLVPMFVIIGLWGGTNRVYATIKFFLYTFIGSVLMLVALIYLYYQAGSFDILSFHGLRLGRTEQILIFLAFFAAFAVKVPMWP
ncbi:MAG: NuoM family protein, partial [Sulfurifustaceae bacterium]